MGKQEFITRVVHICINTYKTLCISHMDVVYIIKLRIVVSQLRTCTYMYHKEYVLKLKDGIGLTKYQFSERICNGCKNLGDEYLFVLECGLFENNSYHYII